MLKLARYYVGVLAATILFIATNAGMIGISRLSWSLSEHRQLPRLFSQLHSKYRTPWFTLIFFSVLASTLIIYGNTEVLGNLYSFGAMLSFTTAHAAIVALRVKDPDRERPYRTPGGIRIHGYVIPMAAVIGGIGTAAAWVAVTVLHTEARVVGIPWMIVGMAGYFYYRKRQGLDPRRSYRIARAERPADFEELEYRTALVPIFGDDVSASALGSAAKLIGEEGVVYAIFVLPVPSQLSLEAGLEEEEAHGRSVLESARIQARRAGIKIHTGLIRTRNPGAALVEEAERVGSDVIYWSAIHAPGRRAAHRSHGRVPAQQATVPRDHRDRQPSRATSRGCHRAGLRSCASLSAGAVPALVRDAGVASRLRSLSSAPRPAVDGRTRSPAPAAWRARHGRRWSRSPPSRRTSSVAPRPAPVAAEGRASTLPSALENARLVTGSGAVALTGPLQRSSSSAASIIPTTSSA